MGESGGTRVRKQLRPWQATLGHMHPSFPSGAQSPPASMVQRWGSQAAGDIDLWPQGPSRGKGCLGHERVG